MSQAPYCLDSWLGGSTALPGLTFHGSRPVLVSCDCSESQSKECVECFVHGDPLHSTLFKCSVCDHKLRPLDTVKCKLSSLACPHLPSFTGTSAHASSSACTSAESCWCDRVSKWFTEVPSGATNERSVNRLKG